MADTKHQETLPHLDISRTALPHIGITREPDFEFDRRRRSGHRTVVPSRTRSAHGSAINKELDSAVSGVAATRQSMGIAPDRLLVVEFRSWDPGCRDVFERFGASVVDERLVKSTPGDQMTHVLVQFPTRGGVSQFEDEIALYRQNSNRKTTLPPKLRAGFFDGLETIRAVSRDERLGNRLRAEGFPAEEPFAIDVDLWHPGGVEEARAVLDELRRFCTARGGRVEDDLRTSSLILARVQTTRELAESLLNLDMVAQVNLPPVLPSVYNSLFHDIDPLPDHAQPTGDEPVVTMLDSGVLAAHPLLRGWVLDEDDFDSGEETTADLHGHGTQVAGLIIYGDIAQCLEKRVWLPQVMVANAKVLRQHPVMEDWVIFPDNRRPEAVVEKAIRRFHTTHDCRVFNLSLGNMHDVYDGGRQFAWAEVLDQLSRELDVVIVISAGNNPEPDIPHGPTTREAFQRAVRDALLENPSARLCNPATSSISLTVGAITRSDLPRTRGAFAGAPKDAPAPFSRIGPGYESKPTQRAVKPELVAYGGNYAIRALAGGPATWLTRDIRLGEPTTRRSAGDERLLTAVSGTSFAAPHVSHAAAWALNVVTSTLGSATANAARALLGVSARTPLCGDDWLRDPKREETWEKLRLVGYGMVDIDRVRTSLMNDLCLIASDMVEEDHWHVYAVPIPPSFLAGRGKRGLSVALAYDPPVRASRREYLSRTMWIEVLKGLSLDEVRRYRTPKTGPGRAPPLPPAKELKMRPNKTDLQWSTLQVRRKEWAQAPKLSTSEGQEAALHILVGCQGRFPPGEDRNQRYSLAVRFWHSDALVDIYQQIRTRVRLRAVVQARVERRG